MSTKAVESFFALLKGGTLWYFPSAGAEALMGSPEGVGRGIDVGSGAQPRREAIDVRVTWCQADTPM